MTVLYASLLYACDPGYSKSNATGRAEFVDGHLVSCEALTPKGVTFIERALEIVGWMRCPEFLHTYHSPIDVFAVENPKIYPGPQQKGDPDDVVLLATLAGMIASGSVVARRLKLPRPQEWKGNVPKDVMLKRIEGRLSPEEKAVLERGKGKLDAKLDAIGIGLAELGRLSQR